MPDQYVREPILKAQLWRPNSGNTDYMGPFLIQNTLPIVLDTDNS